MREIKFRMFIKSLNEMIDNDGVKGACGGLLKAARMATGIEGKGGLYLPTDDEDIIFLQYTGLTDKNGKEIYEGDVLLFNNDYPNAQKMDWKCVVKYRKGSFVCEYPKDGVYNHFDSWNVPKVTWEVIGNIYENPSLLDPELLEDSK
ncbi:YopX family protein [Heyndrickxia sporothermodurans]|uniref:YopX family protein n=1 Tax=Heyndrickxia sporothermodurans TaxID=46224 RepID=UPI002E1F402F|nr:YopX family protein [Heyndrickxia sporothermodurans]MED3697391.1 YopX family protein [Heyndrickxia sporothermodurans]